MNHKNDEYDSFLKKICIYTFWWAGDRAVCMCVRAEWEAVAMFDYVARSPAELSFKQGELLILHSKASCDWWRGEVGGVKGLIPHKYISVLEGWVTLPQLYHCPDDLPLWLKCTIDGCQSQFPKICQFVKISLGFTRHNLMFLLPNSFSQISITCNIIEHVLWLFAVKYDITARRCLV